MLRLKLHLAPGGIPYGEAHMPMTVLRLPAASTGLHISLSPNPTPRRGGVKVGEASLRCFYSAALRCAVSRSVPTAISQVRCTVLALTVLLIRWPSNQLVGTLSR
jgi:hypothetical protein